MYKRLIKLKSKLELLRSSKDYFYVIQGYLNKWKFNNNLLPLHMVEQILYRIRLNSTKPCIQNGECIKCGCYIIEKLCSNKPDDCYPPFMDKINWELYKALNKA